MNSNEVARTRIYVGSSIDTDYRQDIELEWRSNGAEAKPKAQAVTVADLYQRSADNQALFSKAQSTMVKK